VIHLTARVEMPRVKIGSAAQRDWTLPHMNAVLVSRHSKITWSARRVVEPQGQAVAR
jgi:hypothetical protein